MDALKKPEKKHKTWSSWIEAQIEENTYFNFFFCGNILWTNKALCKKGWFEQKISRMTNGNQIVAHTINMNNYYSSAPQKSVWQSDIYSQFNCHG